MAFADGKLPARVMQQCIDAASDKLMNTNFGGGAQENCAKQDMQQRRRHHGRRFGVQVRRRDHDLARGGHRQFRQRLYRRRHLDARGRAPAPGMPATGATHMKIEAKWLGPCAAGQRPGDVIMGNGFKMNMLDMQKRRGMPPKRP